MGNKENSHVKRVNKRTSVIEYKCDERFLETQAKEGWILEKKRKNQYFFTKEEPKDLEYKILLKPEWILLKSSKHLASEGVNENVEDDWHFVTKDSGYAIWARERNFEGEVLKDQFNVSPRAHYEAAKEILVNNELMQYLPIIAIYMFILITKTNTDYNMYLTNRGLWVNYQKYILTIFLLSIWYPSIKWLVVNKRRSKQNKAIQFNTEREFKKKIKKAKILLFTFIALFGIFVLDGLWMRLGISLFKSMFLPAFILVCLAFWWIYKYAKKVSQGETGLKKFQIVVSVVSLIALIVFVNIAVFQVASLGHRGNDTVPVESEALVLSLEDFGTYSNDSMVSYRQKRSILVPKSFYYWVLSRRDSKESDVRHIKMEYMRCITKGMTDFLVEKIVREEEVDFTQREDYYISENLEHLLLIKDKEIFWIESSDLDFSNEEMVDFCKNKLLNDHE